jgi:uncharacterized protein (TIGR02646 family)
MIKKSRLNTTTPSVLTDQNAISEYNEIQAYYRLHGNTPSKLFKVYSKDEVKKELTELFYGKCAYCETPYAVSGDLNIEHYRPKSLVKIEEDNRELTGYWWLASAWNNLLPSCKRCNCVYIYEFNGGKFSLGKGNFFPISNVLYRNRVNPRVNDEQIEVALLIDPSIDNPMDYLIFDFTSKESIVNPKYGSLKGVKSIQHYALNRPDLVKERTKEVKRFANELVGIEETFEDLLSASSLSTKKKYISRIKKRLLDLKSNYLDIQKHSYIQAKFSYLIQWLTTYDEKNVNRILDLINIE